MTDFFWRRLREKPKGFGEKQRIHPRQLRGLLANLPENYPFFALHQVDWDSVDRTYRPQVTAHTSPKELFDIFWNMTDKLNDAHVYLKATSFPELQAESWGRRPDIIESARQSRIG